ncbi:MAG: TetR/AcrR family transcriptional regulator [Bacteroidota bacterium]
MKKENIRQHIITVASELFYAQGYNVTGVNEIISKANIAKATLYHHFRSKEDLCIAYLQQKHEQFLDELQGYIAEGESPKHQVLGIFELLRDRYRKKDFYGCWSQKIVAEITPQNKRIFPLIQKHKKELLTTLGNVVQDSVALISKAEREKLAGGLYLLYEGAVTESYLHKNDWPIHLAKQMAADLFLTVQLKR